MKKEESKGKNQGKHEKKGFETEKEGLGKIAGGIFKNVNKNRTLLIMVSMSNLSRLLNFFLLNSSCFDT